MAKEKKGSDLSQSDLYFTVQKSNYKVSRFYPQTMLVDVDVFENGIKIEQKRVPFAQLPREIKKRIKPN